MAQMLGAMPCIRDPKDIRGVTARECERPNVERRLSPRPFPDTKTAWPCKLLLGLRSDRSKAVPAMSIHYLSLGVIDSTGGKNWKLQITDRLSLFLNNKMQFFTRAVALPHLPANQTVSNFAARIGMQGPLKWNRNIAHQNAWPLRKSIPQKRSKT